MSQEIKICSDASGCFLGGLSAQDTIQSEKLVVSDCGFKKTGGSSSHFLKADGSTDSASYTTCTGTTTPSNTQTFTNKSGNISQWTNNSGYTTCTGTVVAGDISSFTTCTGTTTPSNTQTFTNKSGNISQWTNNSGYTTCTGDITNVTTGEYLTGGGASGAVEVGIDSACASKWDTAAAGDISAVVAGTNLTGGGTSGSVTLNMATGGAGAGTYGSTANQTKIDTITLDAYGRVTAVATGDTGDILGVTAGDGLSGGGSSGTVTVGLDATTAACLNQSGCAGLNCTGDITAVTAGTNLTGGGSSGSVTLNMATGGIGSGTYGNTANSCKIDTITVDAYGRVTNVVCGPTGDIATITLCDNLLSGSNLTSGNACIGIDSGALDYLDQSGCAGLNCVGTVVASDISGFTSCTGDITGVTAGDGITGGATSGTASVAVDSTVVRTTGTQTVGGSKTFSSSACFSTGTAAAPGIAFSADTNTGLTTGTDTLCFVAGGASRGHVTSAGITSLSNLYTGSGGSFRNFNGRWHGTTGTTGCGFRFENTADTVALDIGSTGDTCAYGSLSAQDEVVGESIVKRGGTSSQFLKADGSVDSSGYTTCTGTVVAGDISGFTGCTGTTTPSNTQTFTNKSGNISQWTNDSGYTTCTGTTTPSNTQTFTNKSGNISQWTNNSGYTTCTGTTTPSNTQTFTNKSGNISQWTNDSGYTSCAGDITGVTAGTLLDGGGTSGSVTLNVDLSELPDGTGAIVTGSDEIVYLDNGVQKRKLFSEIFGNNAYNSTTIPTNNNQLTNGSGYTTCTGTVVAGDISGFTGCTGTTTPSNVQTFTNKSGNISQWTNDSGYTTCTGTVVAGDISGFTTCTGTTTPSNTQTFTNKSGNISQWANDSGYTTCNGDITGVTAGTLLDGGGTSGSVTLNVDLSELTDGTAAVVPSTDEVVYLDAGVQKRKLFSEIFGSNAYNSTTIPTNNNQLTNGNGYTTCTGTTTPSNSQTFTNKGGNISQWTNDSGYTSCNGDITGVTAGTGMTGGGTSGSVTLNVIGGDGITANANDIALDSTVVRTSGDQLIAGIKCFSSEMCTTGLLCAQSQILSAGQDLHALLGGGGGTTYTGGNGVTVFGTLISTCFYGDFSQKIMTTCGSICLGVCAGKSISEGVGVGNVFIGACTGCTTSTGDENLAIGKQALQQNSTGSRNVAIGAQAGFRITGTDNLVFGRAAGCGITSGGCNVVIGNYAHRTSTNNGTGGNNVAIGNQAMRDAVSGNCNVAIGFCAAQELSTGCKNIALGPCALGATTGIVTGHCNIAIGEATAWKNTSGSNNIAMGFVALGCNCTGSCNVAIGYTAGRFTGTGTTQMQAPTRSIFIGCDSTGGGGSATNNEIVIGSGAVGCGSNTAMIGSSSVTVVCSHGSFSTVSDRRDKTCICDLELGLEFIGDLKPKTFNMITDRNDPEGSISCKRHGFIAQDVLSLEGDDNVIISTKNSERLGITETNIIPILVKGMQEQQAMIDDLKERLEVLEG